MRRLRSPVLDALLMPLFVPHLYCSSSCSCLYPPVLLSQNNNNNADSTGSLLASPPKSQGSHSRKGDHSFPPALSCLESLSCQDPGAGVAIRTCDTIKDSKKVSPIQDSSNISIFNWLAVSH